MVGNDPVPYLNALAICHYVWGSLQMLFGFFPIIYIVLGTFMLRGSNMFVPPNSSAQLPPQFLGWFFLAGGGCGMIVSWGLGIATILSGRCIHGYRRRIFSFVIAGINCAWFPFGTALGIFTFILLSRPETLLRYRMLDEQKH